jgi:hypothetical protein
MGIGAWRFNPSHADFHLQRRASAHETFVVNFFAAPETCPSDFRSVNNAD